MEATITLKDLDSGFSEKYDVKDIKDKDPFSYIDSEGVPCFIDIHEDGLIIKRAAPDHDTRLVLRENPYAEISTEEGIFTIYVKVLEYSKNNDNILIVYNIEDVIKSIEIRYFRSK